MIRQPQSLRIKADLILVFVAMLWGSAFVVQRAVSNQIGVFIFNGVRFLLASMILLGVIFVVSQEKSRHRKSKAASAPEGIQRSVAGWEVVYTTLAGILLFSASYFQQAGLRFTSAGNAGFITSLYVVLVPLLLWIFWGTKISRITWAGAFLAVIGSLMLSAKNRWELYNGDVLVLIGALFWGLHVILVGIAGRRINILSFAFGQYFLAGVLNMIFSLRFEAIEINWLVQTGWGIVYTGLFSIALGYTLQIFAQKYSPASDAAIILSMEAVFAAMFGHLFLDEFFSYQQIIGCVLILIAIIIISLRANTMTDMDNLEMRSLEIGSEK